VVAAGAGHGLIAAAGGEEDLAVGQVDRVVVVVVVVLVAIAAAMYNGLVRLNVRAEEAWSDITVPLSWQMAGYGRPHYTNVQFPFPWTRRACRRRILPVHIGVSLSCPTTGPADGSPCGLKAWIRPSTPGSTGTRSPFLPPFPPLIMLEF